MGVFNVAFKPMTLIRSHNYNLQYILLCKMNLWSSKRFILTFIHYLVFDLVPPRACIHGFFPDAAFQGVTPSLFRLWWIIKPLLIYKVKLSTSSGGCPIQYNQVCIHRPGPETPGQCATSSIGPSLPSAPTPSRNWLLAYYHWRRDEERLFLIVKSTVTYLNYVALAFSLHD